MRLPYRMLCKPCTVLAAVAILAPHAAAAQPKEEAYTLLVYQVGDLVLSVCDYPYPSGGGSSLAGVVGGMGGMGMGIGMGVSMGGMGTSGEGLSTAPAPAQITMDELKQAIISLVEPSSWEEHGGSGSVGQLGSCLMVHQTAAVHRKIEGFLKQLREGSGKRKTVAIDARWLFLDSDQLDQLMPPDKEGRPQVDRKVLAAFTRRPSSIRGLTNCFSGQLVYLVSGTRQSVVSSYIPVVGSADKPEQRGAQFASLRGGADYVFTSQNAVPGGGMQPTIISGNGRSVGYQPVVEKPNFGALLEIRPTVVSGETTAVVDLRSTLTVPGEQSAGLIGQPAPDQMAPGIDRVAIETHQLATTLRMPLGQPVLVGGLTYVPSSMGSFRDKAQPAARQPQEATTETPQLYLVLELR
jgi:hypothetical protein